MNTIALSIHEKAEKHWHNMMSSLTPSINPLVSRLLFNGIVATYEAPERTYHNLFHIVSMLDEAQQCDFGLQHPPEFLLSIWLHDIVYDTHATNNEEKSAEVAKWIASRLGMPEHTLACIERDIMATKHVSEPEKDFYTRLIADLDLSILGKTEREFDSYETSIRQEYVWVSETVYRVKRADILTTLLDRPYIYGHAFFRVRYEEQARKNLRRSIARLIGK